MKLARFSSMSSLIFSWRRHKSSESKFLVRSCISREICSARYVSLVHRNVTLYYNNTQTTNTNNENKVLLEVFDKISNKSFRKLN